MIRKAAFLSLHHYGNGMADCDNTRHPFTDTNMDVSTQRQILFRQTDGVCYAHALINSILVTPVRELLMGHLETRVSKMTDNDVAFCERGIDAVMAWTPGTEFTFLEFMPKLRRSSYANITRAMLLAFFRRMTETDADDYVVDRSVSFNVQADVFFVFCAQKLESRFMKKTGMAGVTMIGEKVDKIGSAFFKLLSLCDVAVKRRKDATECVFDGGSLLVVTGEPPTYGDAIDCKCVGGLLLSTKVGHAMAYSVVGERIRVFDSNFGKPYDLCDFVKKYRKFFQNNEARDLHECDEKQSHIDVLETVFDMGYGWSTSYYVRKNPHGGGMVDTLAAPRIEIREPVIYDQPEVPEDEIYACLMSLALAHMVEAPSQSGGGRRYVNYALAAIVAAMAVFGA